MKPLLGLQDLEHTELKLFSKQQGNSLAPSDARAHANRPVDPRSQRVRTARHEGQGSSLRGRIFLQVQSLEGRRVAEAEPESFRLDVG